MPDIPRPILEKAALAVSDEWERSLHSPPADWNASPFELAKAALESVAEDLGEVVAGKILAFMESLHPETAAPFSPTSARSRWRRHLKAAARVAGRAFLSDEDCKRIALRELLAGNAIHCPSLEDGDG